MVEDNSVTQRITSTRVKAEGEQEQVLPKTLEPPLSPRETRPNQVDSKRVAASRSHFNSPRDAAMVHVVEEQCRGFCISLFLREQEPVRSLGVTSSVPGEGGLFVAFMMARVLAKDSARPVMLIDCDWEHAGLHDYIGLPSTPGLAEWLRGECAEQDILHEVAENLTIVLAGKGQQDAVRLLQQVKNRDFREAFTQSDVNLVVRLPSVTTTSYSIYAASMVDALVLVVRAGFTTDNLVADACAHLKNLPMQGIILNQAKYRSRLHHPERKTAW